jgi:hypothetical protein
MDDDASARASHSEAPAPERSRPVQFTTKRTVSFVRQTGVESRPAALQARGNSLPAPRPCDFVHRGHRTSRDIAPSSLANIKGQINNVAFVIHCPRLAQRPPDGKHVTKAPVQLRLWGGRGAVAAGPTLRIARRGRGPGSSVRSLRAEKPGGQHRSSREGGK